MIKQVPSAITGIAVMLGAAAALALLPPGIAEAQAEQSCVIDFEGLPTGATITSLTAGNGISGCTVSGAVTVESTNSLFSSEAAIVFDSDCASPCIGTAGDSDLGSPNETFGGPGVGSGGEAGMPFENDTALGQIAILADDKTDTTPADGLVDDPDDADVPGEFRFDFTGIDSNGVTVGGVTIMDVEFDQNENPAEVILIRKNAPPSVLTVVDTGDNGVATIAGIGIENVKQMVVKVKGSSALASITLGVAERACWATFGGFNSAFIGQEGQKFASFGGNVGPPPSGHLNIKRHSDGSHLRVPTVDRIACDRIEAVCPTSGGDSPGQPGGNKGFDANVLLFVGSGLLTDPSGSTNSVSVRGALVDCGEPQGKKNRDPDQFHIATDGALFVSGPLGGGNVQLHPPVPNN